MQATYREKLLALHGWDEDLHPRDERGRFGDKGGGEGTVSTEEHGEYYHTAADALHSLLNKETANVQPGDVRAMLKQARELPPDTVEPDLTDLHVNGKLVFGGNGLGIPREKMPQIPKEMRADYVNELRAKGVKFTKESLDPRLISPTQREISARKAGEIIQKYDHDKHRPFPPILISKDGHVLDGHHHWAAMAALALDHPGIKIPVYRLNVTVKEGLKQMQAFDKKHKIESKAAGAHDVVDGRLDLDVDDNPFLDRLALVLSGEWAEAKHPRGAGGKFGSGTGGAAHPTTHAPSQKPPTTTATKTKTSTSAPPTRPPVRPLSPTPAVAPGTPGAVMDYGYGNRYGTNTPKGLGYFGPLKRADGGVMTEFSIGVNVGGKEQEVPTFVPTLTPEELASLLALPDGQPVPPAIVQKAMAHAAARIAKGQDPFAQPGEQAGAYPQIARAEVPAGKLVLPKPAAHAKKLSDRYDLPNIADVSFPTLIGAVDTTKPKRKRRRPYHYKGVHLSRRPMKFEVRVLSLTEIPPRLDLATQQLLDADTDAQLARTMQDIATYGSREVLRELVRQGAPDRLLTEYPPLVVERLCSTIVADRSLELSAARAQILHKLSQRHLRGDRVQQWTEHLLARRTRPMSRRYAARAVNEAFAFGRTTTVDAFRRTRGFDLAKQYRDENGKFISVIDALAGGDVSVDAVVQTAIMDTNTCDECADVDGEVMDFGDDRQLELHPPYALCLGEDRCRCIQVALLDDGSEINVDEIEEDTIDNEE